MAFTRNNYWLEKEMSDFPYLLERQAQDMLRLPVKIRGMYQSMTRWGIEIQFYYEDRIFEGFLREGYTVEALTINEKPKPRCVSCGEEGFCLTHDIFGRCENTIKKFWKNVRKVYWHWYSKSK